MFRFNVIVLSLTLAGGLIAQQAPCPDQIIKTVEPSLRAESPQSCGSNATGTLGGISISTPVNICPLMVIVRPGHDTTVARRGSGTFTWPVKSVPIQLRTFQCETSWLLGLIPIVISARCVPGESSTAGEVTHYAQRPCRQQEDPGDETTDEPENHTGAGDAGGPDQARWERTP